MRQECGVQFSRSHRTWRHGPNRAVSKDDPGCRPSHYLFDTPTLAIMTGWEPDNCHEKSKFNEAQIVFRLQQAESGVTVAQVCRKLGISEATFSREWAYDK
jgi:hypothetical protein